MELEYHENHLPADLSAPPAVLRWRLRAIAIAGVFAVLAVIDLLISHNFDYVLRGWLMGLMICLSFCLGGLALLMVQWVSGGKWGLLIRRPLEAMSRTLPLLFLMFLPIAIFAKRLYIWAKVHRSAGGIACRRHRCHAGTRHRIQAAVSESWKASGFAESSTSSSLEFLCIS